MARDRTPRRQAKGEREPIFEVPSSGRPRGLKVNREEGGRERERERESEATVPPAGSKGIKGDCTKVAGMPDVGKKDDSHRGMLIPTWWRSQGLRSGERISLSLSLSKEHLETRIWYFDASEYYFSRLLRWENGLFIFFLVNCGRNIDSRIDWRETIGLT